MHIQSSFALTRATTLASAALAVFLVPSATSSDSGGVTSRASLSTAGAQGNANSGTGIGSAVALSSNGKYAVFVSTASNLVPGDTNGQADIFVRDLSTGVTERVSVASNGTQSNGPSTHPRISNNGRWVVFHSSASTLAAGDAPGVDDVFRHDRQTGATILVNVPMAGTPNGVSQGPTISDDGRYVAFWSSASNLVPGDTNGVGDCFLRDMFIGTTTRVSVSGGGAQGNNNSFSPYVSRSGDFVSFTSRASNLMALDNNGVDDVFVRDLAAGSTTMVGPVGFSSLWNGHSGESSISDDGRFVGFSSLASNIVTSDTNNARDVFLYDRLTTFSVRASETSGFVGGDGDSGQPLISGDGTLIVYETEAENLAPGNNGAIDILVFDRPAATNTVASLDQNGNPANSLSGHPFMASDATRVAFVSFATDLVPGDSNGNSDVFVRLCGSPPPILYCDTADNSEGCVPHIEYSGSASATAGSGFEIKAVEIISNQFGILFYGVDGTASTPLGFGTVCVGSPTVRTDVQNSGGNPGTDCSGTFSFDFNALVASGSDASLVVGQTVWAQYWSRDPGFAPPNNTSLTDAIEFVIGP